MDDSVEKAPSPALRRYVVDTPAQPVQRVHPEGQAILKLHFTHLSGLLHLPTFLPTPLTSPVRSSSTGPPSPHRKIDTTPENCGAPAIGKIQIFGRVPPFFTLSMPVAPAETNTSNTATNLASPSRACLNNSCPSTSRSLEIQMIMPRPRARSVRYAKKQCAHHERSLAMLRLQSGRQSGSSCSDSSLSGALLIVVFRA